MPEFHLALIFSVTELWLPSNIVEIYLNEMFFCLQPVVSTLKLLLSPSLDYKPQEGRKSICLVYIHKQVAHLCNIYIAQV